MWILKQKTKPIGLVRLIGGNSDVFENQIVWPTQDAEDGSYDN
jgi:hypothetical protein